MRLTENKAWIFTRLKSSSFLLTSRSERVGTDLSLWAGKKEQTEWMDMKNLVSKFFKDESGATAIEYGLIAALIAVAIITVVGLVGTNLTATFQTVADSM
jgi:pilus assembly protein Flp/PilA